MATGVLVLVGALGWRSRLRRADGRLFAIGLAAWALGHAVVAATWRDAAVLGALNAEQLICLAVAGLAGGSAVVATLAIRRRPDAPIAAPADAHGCEPPTRPRAPPPEATRPQLIRAWSVTSRRRNRPWPAGPTHCPSWTRTVPRLMTTSDAPRTRRPSKIE